VKVVPVPAAPAPLREACGPTQRFSRPQRRTAPSKPKPPRRQRREGPPRKREAREAKRSVFPASRRLSNLEKRARGGKKAGVKEQPEADHQNGDVRFGR
jgi:hypothetical protein